MRVCRREASGRSVRLINSFDRTILSGTMISSEQLRLNSNFDTSRPRLNPCPLHLRKNGILYYFVGGLGITLPRAPISYPHTVAVGHPQTSASGLASQEKNSGDRFLTRLLVLLANVCAPRRDASSSAPPLRELVQDTKTRWAQMHAIYRLTVEIAAISDRLLGRFSNGTAWRPTLYLRILMRQ